MKIENGIFYGSIQSFNEERRTVECIIMHYDVANENMWTAKAGAVDKFLERLKASNKGVSACYQHDEKTLIGKWTDFKSEDGKFTGTLHLSDTPFVNETVIPQLKDGTLQGASPSIYPRAGKWNENDIFEISEGVIGEISLVGLPADLGADILRFAANVDSLKRQDKNNFEINLLTI